MKDLRISQSFGGGGSQIGSETAEQLGCFGRSRSDLQIRQLELFSQIERFCNTHVADLAECLAFTLAEVLITLGIIGVVAVLTLPSVIANYQEKVTVAQVKKAYSILSAGFQSAISDNETIDNWCNQEDLFANCSYKIASIVKPYFKKIKECNHYGASCVASAYKHRFKSSADRLSANGPSFILTDGISVIIQAQAGDTNVNRWCLANKNSKEGLYEIGSGYRQTGYCALIYVDVNGEKEPNTLDKDMFVFKLYRDGVTPNGLPADKVWVNEFKSQCLGERYYSGGACTAWIIVNGNMDYLHCPDKLGWDKASSCKD